jgi:hypothetical protein
MPLDPVEFHEYRELSQSRNYFIDDILFWEQAVIG